MPSVTVTVEGKIVDIPAHLMEGIRQVTMEAFERAQPVGEEIAGLLFGKRNELGWNVAAWRPIPLEDGSRPAVPLTESEEEAAGEILWDYRGDRELRGAEPIGWIRSRTRGMAALSPEDAQVCRRFFGEQRSLAVILRPASQRPMTAAFFYVDADAARQFSLRGVEIQIAADPDALEAEIERREELAAVQAAQAAAQPARAQVAPVQPTPPEATQYVPVVPEQPLFGDFQESQAPSRNWLKIGLGALAGALTTAVVCFLLLDRPLHFDAEIRRSEVVLTWNREAGFMTGVTGAELVVGGNARQLTIPELRSGEAFVPVPSGDFKVVLRLRGPYAENQQAALTFIRPPGYRVQ